MKLESQICTFEQAKKLKKLVVSQQSIFSWFGDEAPRLKDMGADGAEFGPWLWIALTAPVNNQDADHRKDVSCSQPIAAAFTAAELGVMLPPGYDTMYTYEGWRCYDCDGQDIYEVSYGYRYEAECRAAAIIYLLDNGKIKVDEINERLKTE